MAWWSVETQIVSNAFASCNAVSESPNKVNPSIFWMFFNFIPLDPPLASISAVKAVELLEILSKQTSSTSQDDGFKKQRNIKNFFMRTSIAKNNLTETFNLGDYSNETDSCINHFVM